MARLRLPIPGTPDWDDLVKAAAGTGTGPPEDPRTGEDYPDSDNTIAGQRERIRVYLRERNRRHSVKYVPHIRLIASGSLGNGRETFAFGLRGRFFNPGTNETVDSGFDQREAWAEQVAAPAFSAFFSSQGAFLSTYAHLTRLTVANLDSDGKYVDGSSPITVPLDARGAVTNGQISNVPWQVALAVTLRTKYAKAGQGSRGRFYLPMPCQTANGATNALDDGQVTGVATAAKTMLDRINGAATGIDGTAWEFRLYGDGVRKNAPDVTGPTNRVTDVFVGNVLDTIRSRRNSAAEMYQHAELA